MVFGFVAIFWPVITFITLAFVFALYILLSGVLNLIHAIMGIHEHRYWLLTLTLGLFEIAVGTFAINNPLLNIEALTLLIGFTFMIRGIFEIISAFENMFIPSHKILLCVSGILSLIVGLIVLRYPFAGRIAFTWIIGFYALIGGGILVAISMSARELLGVLESKNQRHVK